MNRLQHYFSPVHAADVQQLLGCSLELEKFDYHIVNC